MTSLQHNTDCASGAEVIRNDSQTNSYPATQNNHICIATGHAVATFNTYCNHRYEMLLYLGYNGKDLVLSFDGARQAHNKHGA